MEQEGKKNEVKELFTQFLMEKKCRRTPERYAILDAIYNRKGHFTADALYELLKDDFRVSRATVYNTLSLLVDAGLALCHQFDGVMEYEKCYGVPEHFHQICMKCGSVTEFYNDEIKHTVAKSKFRRFRMTHCSVYVYGVCSKCQARASREKRKRDSVN